MNVIDIFAPRWKDRTVLVADWKIGLANEIRIKAKRADGTPYFPEPFQVKGEKLKQYPVENKPYGNMRIVPLDALERTGTDAKNPTQEGDKRQ